MSVRYVSKDALYAIANSMIPGLSRVRKWGHNSAVTTTEEDIWVNGGVYAFPADAGESLELVSTAADDEEITIQGLDIGFNQQEYNVTLNGTTPVPIPGTWTRVNRAFNNDSTSFTGTVSVRKSGAGAVYASLLPTHQQTSQAIYTIPAGHKGLVLETNCAINRTGAASLAADFFLNTREFGKIFRKKWHAGVQKDGTSHVKDDMVLPECLIEKTDVKMSGVAGTTDISGSAWFYILLIDER
jgi:hypothetical protein